MRRLPSLVVFALATTATVAIEPADPLKSAACEQALQRLRARETQAALAARASLPRPDARVLSMRREAARICLGSRADLPQPPPPKRQVMPPISAMPGAPPATARPVPQPPPVAAPRVEAPTVITSCDPTGCWASDGSRLNRMGQNLLGPRGLCSVQGNLLQCP